MSDPIRSVVIDRPEDLWRVSTRRTFVKLLGLGGTIVLMPAVFEACSKDSTSPTPTPSGGVALDLSNDTGILNYAYALEQLEAGFYTAVVGAAVFGSFNAEQQEVLTDLRNHEVVHREFFRKALGANAIPDLALNMATVTAALATTASILKTSEAFEDLGVSAYNGAGKYLTNPDYLTAAGKIVSVEARHAAAIRDIRESLGVSGGVAAGTRFAGDDIVQPSGTYQGLDVKLEPSAVLSRVVATQFVATSVTISANPPSKSGTPDAGPPNPTP